MPPLIAGQSTACAGIKIIELVETLHATSLLCNVKEERMTGFSPKADKPAFEGNDIGIFHNF